MLRFLRNDLKLRYYTSLIVATPICVLVLLWFGWALAGTWMDYRALKIRGLDTTAVITSIQQPTNGARGVLVTTRFRAADGRSYEAKAVYARGAAAALRVGEQRPIVYDPEWPTSSAPSLALLAARLKADLAMTLILAVVTSILVCIHGSDYASFALRLGRATLSSQSRD